MSATETALETKRLGSLQLRVAALCTLVLVSVGGYLLALGVAPTRIFLVACLFALIAAAATALPAFRGTRAGPADADGPAP